jgi:hypothetical protein
MRLSPANFPTFGTTIGWTAPTNLESENTGFLQFFFTVSKNQPNHNYHTKKPTKILKIHVIFHHTTIKLLGIQK